MSDETTSWPMVEYEGFEIHVTTRPFSTLAENERPSGHAMRSSYLGYVCHPGADPSLPGHVVPFHADGEESFTTAADARYEAIQVGRAIVDGTHPDLTVLPLVTGGV
ncbi:hypothetical protein [Paraburkholderia sp.]|uniref:hypothetical protein n=1 Tax=Paraburkholderia sp. TaxID=1926495 RepID=UPI002388D14C|nr:hypothetical protein [Paraburkholderia sp.]MDE1182794.1 hypothetical protein [Paraburkholderia sp.]